MAKKITYIPSNYIKTYRVGVYCRVSSKKFSQEESLQAQIEHYSSFVDNIPNWFLVDIYSEAISGKDDSRFEFQRMLADCYNNKIDLIVTKSISRFGRNTVDTLDTINRLRAINVDVYFEAENIQLSEMSSDFVISVLAAFDQAEGESTSESIKWGLKRGFESGASKLYSRKCFGYTHDENGQLIIDEEQANIVKMIYELYLSGQSIISITRELATREIKSPTGKDTWSKRAVETILSNEKYTGKVLLGKTIGGDYPNNKRQFNKGQSEQYLKGDSHEAIISAELFDKVKEERERRTNIVVSSEGTVTRKSTHYSSKKKE